LTVTATDTSTSVPLPGANVTLQIYSGTTCSGTVVTNGNSTTNTSGQASFTFNTKKTGNYCASANVTDAGYTTGTGSKTSSVP
jgi:hypothetical protein